MNSDLREHDVRALLSRMAGEMPTPLEVPPQALRRARSKLTRTIVVGVIVGGLASAGSIAAIQAVLSSPSRLADDTAPAGVTAIHVSGKPVHVAASDGVVWVAGRGISKIDPTTNRVVATITSVDGYGINSRREGSAIAIGEGRVWISGGAFDGEVLRIDPETDEITTIHSRGGYSDPYAVTVGAGAIWATNDSAPGGTVSLVRIEPTGLISASIPLEHPRAVAVSQGTVWVHEDTAEGSLVAVDPQTNTVLSRVPTNINGDLVAGFGSLWSMSGTDARIVRLDSATGLVSDSIDIPNIAQYDLSEVDIAVGENAVWVALNDSDEGDSPGHRTVIVRIDPGTNDVVGTLELSARVMDVAAGEGAVWAIGHDDTLYRIDPDAVGRSGTEG